MIEPEIIEEQTGDPATDIALDTISLGKQALVFVNSKRSAESAAEKIAKRKKPEQELTELSQKILKVLSSPTKQCKRLAFCIERGTAFHHSGLHAKQREIVEDAFRDGQVKIIGCTPTLCLSSSTSIWSGTEETSVENFCSSTSVYGIKGSKSKQITPLDVERKFNSREMITISSVCGYQITVTENHKMLIKREGKRLVVPASEILPTDRIATIGKLSVRKESSPKIKDFSPNAPNELKKEHVNADIAYFIGLMIGDGYSGAEITQEETIYYKGSPVFVGVDLQTLAFVESFSKKWGLHWKPCVNSYGTPYVRLSKCKWFREFLVRCGVDKGASKHIHSLLMDMHSDSASALLQGIFDTDGYVERVGNVGFSTISLQLAKQVQKLLLRFGIICRFRERKGKPMQIYEKEYQTKNYFELTISHRESLLLFNAHVGFRLGRKQQELTKIIRKITSEKLFLSCTNCNYKLYQNLFSGRTHEQKIWGSQKKKILSALKDRSLHSNQLRSKLGFEPRKRDSRLNHHYELLDRKRISHKGKTEYTWSLNSIGSFICTQILEKGKPYKDLFKLRQCPLCNSDLLFRDRRNWRSSDVDGDIFWDMIRGIKTAPPETLVYDVVLPSDGAHDHLFVAEGFFVHNSAGINLPAFRAIIRDTKRFSGGGMAPIPVLEYLQMIGRAGRPDFNDEFGEAILVAKTERDPDILNEMYIQGEPEAIWSKVAALPVLRTYCLSLVATEFVKTEEELQDFFAETFFAYQYGDTKGVNAKISDTLNMLREWGFLHKNQAEDDFVSAADLGSEDLKATTLGKRVSELYLDPLSAHHLIKGLARARGKTPDLFSWVHLMAGTSEMRPLPRVAVKDYEILQELVVEKDFLSLEPSLYDPEYENFMQAVKAAKLLDEWANEQHEDYLLEMYNVRPGELHGRLNDADWLLYCLTELARILKQHGFIASMQKTRTRLKYGVKEELVPLLRFKGIGRVRARLLFRNGIKTAGDITSIDIQTLVDLIGKALAANLKKQVGEKVAEIPSPQKRKGQLGLDHKHFQTKL